MGLLGTLRLGFVAWVGVGGLVALCVGVASAQRPTVAVLGVSSEEGDDARAAELTAALRAEIENEASAHLSDSRASLSQMTLLQDCDIAEPECRARVGKAVNADQVIYGFLRRAGTRGHDVELRSFMTDDGTEAHARRALPASDTSDAALAEHARALLAVLRGEAAPQSRALSSSEDGPIPAATVTPNVEPLDESELAASEPASSAEPSSNDWLGYTLLGTAALSAGLTVFSWTQIKAAETDDHFVAYGEAVYLEDRTIEDVCVEADAGSRYGVSAQTLAGARSACDRGQTFDLLQYVFIGATVLSAGLGAYFLLDDEGAGGEASSTRDFSVRAQIGRDRGFVSLRLAL